jgi:serine/threonine protein kinase
MSKQTLTCGRGHRWEYSGPGPLPSDLSSICPACTAADQQTQHHPASGESPAEGSAPQLPPGSALAGFEILGEISRGGMGVIYKARQTGLNRLVALKVIAPGHLRHPDALNRFRREVQAAALLSHPNIVTVHATDLDGPWPYLAMEYVAGIDLHRLVERAGPLPVADACAYARQAALGLEHAFEQGLVHRDIKPANLMVTPSPLDPATTHSRIPRVKILDLGLALLPAAAGARGAGGLTRAGEFLGTPDYIAPEQAEDAHAADIRSDLYSLGCTLFYLLTGEVPFPSANLAQKLRRQLTEPAPSVAARRADVPAELDALLARLLARDPADRFQTPAELAQALEAVLRRPGSAEPPRPVPRAAPAARPAPSTHTSVRQVEAHRGGVQALGVAADGQVLVSGGLDEAIRVWDATRLRETRCLDHDVGPVEGLCLAPGGKWAASCSLRLFREDLVVQVWELATGRELRRLRGHDNRLFCVAVSADGRRLASGGADRTVRLWALDQAGSPSLCLEGHTDQVSSVTFLPGGDVLSGSHDGTVRLWDGKTGGAKGTLPGQVGRVTAVGFDRAGKRVAVAGDGLRLRRPDGSLLDCRGHQGPVLGVAFSADGQWLVSGGGDGSVRVWRVADGAEVHCLRGHAGAVRAVAFGPDGRVVFSGGADGTLRRWPLPA